MTTADEKDIAWAAGLLEGEGCFSLHERSKTGYVTCATHCEMTDEDTVNRLHKIFQVGNVNTRKNMSGRRDPRKRQQTYIWSVQDFKGNFYVLSSILPWMGQRRAAKIRECLEFLKGKL